MLFPVMKKPKDFRCDVGGGEVLIPERKIKDNGWMGPIKYRSDDLPVHASMKTENHAPTVIWKAAQSSEDEHHILAYQK